MKFFRKILAIPFAATLLMGQVCFAATTVSPPPTFTIDPSFLILDPVVLDPVTTTTATDPAVTDPNSTNTTDTGATDPAGTTTTDPNATTTTATPPPEPTTTTDTTGTTGTTDTTPTTDPNRPPVEETVPTTTTTVTPPPSSTPPRTNSIPTEEPVIGILDVPLETTTQEECSAQVLTPICPSPEQVGKSLTPIITENQLKMALLVFFGGGLGALMWVFAANIMNNAQMKREEVRFDRQERASNETRRVEQLSKTYGRLSDTIASLYKESGNKLTLNKDAIKNYLTSSIELEMYGSDESLAAHKEFLGMLTSGTQTTKSDFDQAKNNLIGALKKDLGLSN